MLRLFAWIFNRPLVYTRDFDGAVRLRMVFSDPWKTNLVKGIFSQRGELRANGTIANGSYMVSWLPANKKAEQLFQGD